MYDKQPEKAIESWGNAVKFEPYLAIAYRNLGWGFYRHYDDVVKAIPYYEKAIALNNNEAIYYGELDVLYELSNTPVDIRLKLFEGNNAIVMKRDDAFIRMIEVFTLGGKPDKSVEYLEGKNFTYQEGDSRVREVIIDAQLSLGIKYSAEKNYQKALEHFLEARVPDEEAGSARSGNRDVQVNYYIGLAHEALGNSSAKSFFEMSAKAESSRGATIMSYYQGLSYLKLGNKAKAKEIFNSLVAEGESQLNRDSDAGGDFFAKFGERETENSRK